jgi:uncharacterized protein (TIGR02444 family)
MNIDETNSDDNLWSFSCSLYAKPCIEACCLDLQDRYGVNVTLLLWCLWLERRAVLLTQETLLGALALVDPWDRHYVQPLRKIRRDLKLEFDQGLDRVLLFKQKISEAELLAEKLAMEKLEILSGNLIPTADEIRKGTNLAFFASYMKVPRSALHNAQLAFGLAQTFDSTPEN